MPENSNIISPMGAAILNQASYDVTGLVLPLASNTADRETRRTTSVKVRQSVTTMRHPPKNGTVEVHFASPPDAQMNITALKRAER